MTTLLSGCKKEVVDSQVIQQNAIPVQMSTEKVNYKSSIQRIKLTITNNGNSLVTLGSNYSLEKNKNGKWVDIPFKKNINFIAASRMLNPKKKYEEIIFLNMSDYTFDTGSYRIIKVVYTKGKKNINISCDFTIE